MLAFPCFFASAIEFEYGSTSEKAQQNSVRQAGSEASFQKAGDFISETGIQSHHRPPHD
jgi:hypothetical protein